MANDIIEFPKKGAKDDDANRVGIDRDGDSSPLSVSVPELLEGLIRDGLSQEAVDVAYDQGLLDGQEQQEDCASQQERDLAELDLEDIQSVKLVFLLNLIFTVCASEELDVADVLAGLEAIRDRAND